MIDPNIDIGKELIAKGRRHGIDIIPMLGRSSPEEIIELVEMFDRLDALPADMKLPGVIGGNDTLDPARGLEFGEDEADLQNYKDEEIADFQRDGDNASKDRRRQQQAVRDALLEGELRSPDLAVRNAAIKKLRAAADREATVNLPDEADPPIDYTSRDANGNPIRRTEGNATGAVIKQMALRKEEERGRRVKGFTNKRYNPQTEAWEYFKPDQKRIDIIADDVYYPGHELDAPQFTSDLQFGDMNQPGGLNPPGLSREASLEGRGRGATIVANEVYNNLVGAIESGNLQGEELEKALVLEKRMRLDLDPKFELENMRSLAAEARRQDIEGGTVESNKARGDAAVGVALGAEREARFKRGLSPTGSRDINVSMSESEINEIRKEAIKRARDPDFIPAPGIEITSLPASAEEAIRNSVAVRRPNPIAQIANQLKAEAEADRVYIDGVAAQTPLGTPVNLQGTQGINFIDESNRVMEGLGVISPEKFGHAKYPDQFGGESFARDVRTAYPLPGGDGFVDGRGFPLGIQGPEVSVDFEPPASNPTVLRQWVMDQMAANDDPNKVLPRPIDIGAELGRMNEGLRSLKVGGRPLELDPRGVRSMSDLENVIGSYLEMKQAAGEPIRVGVGGQQVTIENPGVGDVLTQMRIRPGNQQAAAASALYQLENANLQSVNQAKKELFREGVKLQLDRPVATGRQFNAFANENQASVIDPGVQIARISPNEKAPKDAALKKAKDAVAALTGSAIQTDGPLTADELNDAQMPFKGAVAGEAAAPVGFIRGDRRAMSHSERIKVMGPENAAKGEAVLRRHIAAEGRKRSAPNPMDVARNPEQFGEARASGVAFRNADAEAQMMARRAEDYNQDREVGALRSREGKRRAIVQGKGFASPEVDLSRAVGQAFAPPSKELAAQGIARPSVATSAVTSQAPDPTPLAARGGWLGSKDSFRSPNFNDPVAVSTALPERENVRKRPFFTPSPSIQSPSAPSPIREEIARRTSNPSGARNRNKLIRDIVGYTALGAGGSVGAGVGLRALYDSMNQDKEEARY